VRRLEKTSICFIRVSTAMTARRTFQPFLIVALVSGCFGLDPCTDHTRMWMEYGRRSSDFNSRNTATSICDAFLNHDAWYRFEHDAGNRLIEGPVEPWSCGTQAPIWLNGTHPTDTTEVTAKVCATYTSENICGWNGTVRIRLCNESGSEYFVYLLAVPTGCPLAYCVDAASRKECIPPDVWREHDFKCGENITTTPAPPTTPSPTPTGTPSPGWSTWGPWSDCTKPCDYGQQTRRRTCGQVPCPGASTSRQLCAMSNCEGLPEEKDKGIVLSLQSADATQNTMLTVVTNQQTIDTILRTSINSICSQNTSLCCGFKIESISADSIEFVKSDDIYAAKGFPKSISDGTVDYKTIAIVNEAVNQATCSRVRARQVRSTESTFVPYEVMEMAARNSASDIRQETGLVVNDYLDPATYPDDSPDEGPCPVDTCIVPIVVCCTVIPVIAVIVGCITLHMTKKSKTTPSLTPGKDPTKMVNAYVTLGQPVFGGLPA